MTPTPEGKPLARVEKAGNRGEFVVVVFLGQTIRNTNWFGPNAEHNAQAFADGLNHIISSWAEGKEKELEDARGESLKLVLHTIAPLKAELESAKAEIERLRKAVKEKDAEIMRMLSNVGMKGGRDGE